MHAFECNPIGGVWELHAILLPLQETHASSYYSINLCRLNLTARLYALE